jgi:UDPglucose 6-dehydrogenase
MKIGFANEIANVCEKVGADATEVMTSIGLDSRIGRPFLNAGLGWGGSCFGKDIQSLLHTAQEYGYQARLLEASLAVNYTQRLIAIQKLQEKLLILEGRTIALLGLAFKPDTDDLRDAPSLQIAGRLLQLGARVKGLRSHRHARLPRAKPQLKIQYCDSPFDTVSQADAAVLVTEWGEFARLDLPQMARSINQPILIDGRNFYDPETARRAGFDYTDIGRCTRERPPPWRRRDISARADRAPVPPSQSSAPRWLPLPSPARSPPPPRQTCRAMGLSISVKDRQGLRNGRSRPPLPPKLSRQLGPATGWLSGT